MPENTSPLSMPALDTAKSFGLPAVMLAVVCYGFWQTTSTLTTAYDETLKEASKSYRSIAEDIAKERLARENSDVKLDQILALVKK